MIDLMPCLKLNMAADHQLSFYKAHVRTTRTILQEIEC